MAPDGRTCPLRAVVAGLDPGGIETVAAFTPEGSGPEALEAIESGRMALGTGPTVGRCPGPSEPSSRGCWSTRRPARSGCRGSSAPSRPGRVLNPLTARSQLTGGMIWGLGSALLEETILDRGHYRNPDLAEYLVATAADAPEVEALLLPDSDDT